jgi:GntP family gluconate:H+ symporter
MGAPLPSVMLASLLPALLGLAAVVLLVRLVPLKGAPVADADIAGGGPDAAGDGALPPLAGSLAGPLVAIGLLALRPLCGVTIDPLVALPAGGLAGILCMGRLGRLRESLAFGLEKMSVVAVLLAGTGTIAGVIKNSSLREWILGGLNSAGISESLIAPVSGALMSAATASTTAGATIASSSFAETILAAGVSAVCGAAMINAGATVLDHLPHGSFFHATAGCMQVDLKERLKLMPFETLIGGFLAFFSTLFCLVWN